MITDDFQVKLESAIQWEIWEIELLGHLEMIVGANGIALSYVICQKYVPDYSVQLRRTPCMPKSSPSMATITTKYLATKNSSSKHIPWKRGRTALKH